MISPDMRKSSNKKIKSFLESTYFEILFALFYIMVTMSEANNYLNKGQLLMSLLFFSISFIGGILQITHIGNEVLSGRAH